MESPLSTITISPSLSNYESPNTSPETYQNTDSFSPAFEFVSSYNTIETSKDKVSSQFPDTRSQDQLIELLSSRIDQLTVQNAQKDLELAQLRSAVDTVDPTNRRRARLCDNSLSIGTLGRSNSPPVVSNLGSTFNPTPGAPSPANGSLSLLNPQSTRPSPSSAPMGLGLLGLGSFNATSNPWNKVQSEGDGSATTRYSVTESNNRFQSTHSFSGETINYRQLLESESDADYNMLCREIISKNNQQASIFMQQKIKIVGSDDRKKLILSAVMKHALSLMTNKFGNFLVSRCLEHGGESWRHEFSLTVQGNVYEVACDAYGVHVVQKMCDYEDYTRKMIVTELVIHEDTFTHKSAGHVWTKILSYPLQKDLHEQLLSTLRGSWSKIAQDETGSLLVQSCLENWNKNDKVEIVQAILADIVPCALTGWGNFVVLNLIEHGAENDRPIIFESLLNSAVELSLSHTGAKTIEKMMKVAGLQSDVVTKYVDRIVTPGVDGRRPACIEIACHGPGSQILTVLFTGATQENKDKLIGCIRRHGVTMKSSKHGSRIFYLVERTRAWTGH